MFEDIYALYILHLDYFFGTFPEMCLRSVCHIAMLPKVLINVESDFGEIPE